MGALVASRLGLVGVTAQIFRSRLVAAILAQFCEALLGQQVPVLQMPPPWLGSLGRAAAARTTRNGVCEVGVR